MSLPSKKSRKEEALELLESIRAELEDDAVDKVAEGLGQLSSLMSEWQRSLHVQAARNWLDTAFDEDVLAFDAGTAREHLQKWADASAEAAESPELIDYRKRIEARDKSKHEALFVRGVISHCDELLSQAQTMEISSEAPAPDFMLRQYYQKARAIAVAAQSEHEKNTDLGRLIQRVERLFQQKESAIAVYTMAIESQKYSNALHNLEQLPTDFLVPRFTTMENLSGEKRLSYQGMVELEKAREEISLQAQSWASSTAEKAIKTSQQYLEAHEPAEAVEELDLGENVEKFLNQEQKDALQVAKTNATSQLRNREKAEERATRALEILADEPLKAWDEYTAALGLFEWIDGLEEVKQAVLKTLRGRLKAMARDADLAFHEQRDMARVRQICQRAKSSYAGKDASLDEQLAKFDEYEEMVKSYEEYLVTGGEILEKVKAFIWEDAVAANDLLTQVESYPDFVLEAFPSLYELRVQVNQRLNAEQTYNQLYKALFNETMHEITQAIEHTKVAGEDFPDDKRFQTLAQWLQYHMAFLSGRMTAERGLAEQAMQLIAPVLNNPEHPDYDEAQKLRRSLETAAKKAEENEDEEV
jgi:hypothetical protein